MSTSGMDGNKPKGNAITRRDALKGLVTIPIAGALLYKAFQNRRIEHLKRNDLLRELGFTPEHSQPVKVTPANGSSDTLRIGIIGFGIRGEQLLRAAGFAHPEVIDQLRLDKASNRADTRLDMYLEQTDLNIQVTAVCEIFSVAKKRAIEASANRYRNGAGGEMGTPAKFYSHYKDLLHAEDVDAVIIATPDHWHAEMTIEAAKAGKHVYIEKPLTRTVKETYDLERAVLDAGIVLQLGHQNRQVESHQKAREVIKKGILGKISMVEVYTNRNSPNGAWVYDLHPDANEETIDWPQFLGNAPYHPFSREHFFRWRCWWEYSTGLTGDLFTHEYDAINQMMSIGIPHSAVASGGIYFFKDGRTVPDTLHVSYEFPKLELNLLYNATLSSSKHRSKTFLGHDAHMVVDMDMVVFADRESTRFREMIEQGRIKPEAPILTHIPGRGIDAVSSATEQYFAKRGLLYTYQNGRRVDTTHLHIKEWLDVIRNGGQTSCGMPESVEEAISAHMGTEAYRRQTKVFWDEDRKEIVSA